MALDWCQNFIYIYLHLQLTVFRLTILDQLALSTDEGQLIARHIKGQLERCFILWNLNGLCCKEKNAENYIELS